jgi:integrase
MRINEVNLLTVAKLRELIKAGEGVIYTPKKAKERKIFLSHDAVKNLKHLIKKEDNDKAYLTSSWNKETTAMHETNLILMVNIYMKKVLGNGYTSHSFRQMMILVKLDLTANSRKVLVEVRIDKEVHWLVAELPIIDDAKLRLEFDLQTTFMFKNFSEALELYEKFMNGEND